MDLKQEIYNAYLAARKHKRNSPSQLEFERTLESNLLQLCKELKKRTYKMSPCTVFISERPVKREIVAANFRDRVVHHLLCNWVCPIFERQFIYDSYSCRVGKGTKFAVERARHFAMAASENFTKECFVLRLNISGFFMNINRNILYKLVVNSLRRANYANVSDKNLCIFLVRLFIFSPPLAGAFYKSPKSAWIDLPKNKSLKYANKNCGLPIGNLPSQWFGNVYLNLLDQFIKRKLKFIHYGRYVDDMLLLHQNKNELLKAKAEIAKFLRERLHLELNEKKLCFKI